MSRQRRAGGIGVQGCASKTPDEPRPTVESALLHLNPENSPFLDTKHPLHKPKILCQNPLDTQFPFSYIQLAQKGVLSNINSLEGE
jgi:hypothetical protein